MSLFALKGNLLASEQLLNFEAKPEQQPEGRKINFYFDGLNIGYEILTPANNPHQRNIRFFTYSQQPGRHQRIVSDTAYTINLNMAATDRGFAWRGTCYYEEETVRRCQSDERRIRHIFYHEREFPALNHESIGRIYRLIDQNAVNTHISFEQPAYTGAGAINEFSPFFVNPQFVYLLYYLFTDNVIKINLTLLFTQGFSNIDLSTLSESETARHALNRAMVQMILWIDQLGIPYLMQHYQHASALTASASNSPEPGGFRLENIEKTRISGVFFFNQQPRILPNRLSADQWAGLRDYHHPTFQPTSIFQRLSRTYRPRQRSRQHAGEPPHSVQQIEQDMIRPAAAIASIIFMLYLYSSF